MREKQQQQNCSNNKSSRLQNGTQNANNNKKAKLKIKKKMKIKLIVEKCFNGFKVAVTILRLTYVSNMRHLVRWRSKYRSVCFCLCNFTILRYNY